MAESAPWKWYAAVGAGVFAGIFAVLSAGYWIYVYFFSGGWTCYTNWEMPGTNAMAKKGLCIDDTTFSTCPDRVPVLWPNTNDRVQTIRMFKAWDESWTGNRQAANDAIAQWARDANGKVLLGVEVTCDKEKNDLTWGWAKDLLRALGPEHVFGLAVGNEMDLYLLKDQKKFNITADCINEQWGWGQPDNGMNSSYMYRLFLRSIAEMDALPGFAGKEIPLTTVLSGVSLANTDKTKPFMDGSPGWFDTKKVGHAMVNTLLVNLTTTLGQRFAASLNIYPYFDDNGNRMDINSSHRCTETVYTDLCFNNQVNEAGFQRCKFIGTAINFRKKLVDLTKRTNDTFWVAEFGWSYPAASTLKKPMNICTDFTSQQAFVSAYQGFLQWDVTLPGVEPPSHVFYFTIRDSVNFGQTESFGLIDSCSSSNCKLQCNEDGCPRPYCWASGSQAPCYFHHEGEPLLDPKGSSIAHLVGQQETAQTVSKERHTSDLVPAVVVGMAAASVFLAALLRFRRQAWQQEDGYFQRL